MEVIEKGYSDQHLTYNQQYIVTFVKNIFIIVIHKALEEKQEYNWKMSGCVRDNAVFYCNRSRLGQ